MDVAMKKKWLEALRSGVYEQGKDYLRRGESFCCLGVLCDLSKTFTWEEYTRIPYDSYNNDMIYFYDNNEQFLSEIMLEISGITPKEMEHLAELNDSGQSFEQIADYIERCL